MKFCGLFYNFQNNLFFLLIKFFREICDGECDNKEWPKSGKKFLKARITLSMQVILIASAATKFR